MRNWLGARTGALLAVVVAAGAVTPAMAIGSTAARGKAQLAVQQAETGVSSIQQAVDRVKRSEATPAKRIAAGDLLMRTKDYERAIVTFSQVVELHRQGKMPETSYADALFLLGETYFKDEQYLSAARHYREIAENGARSPYDTYVGRALSRLVDVALRTQHLDRLDYVFAKMNQLPTSDATGSLQYARGKAYFGRRDYSAARSALQGVSQGSKYAHQAGYLLGVILTSEATAGAATADTPTVLPTGPDQQAQPADARRFAAAIEQFRKVTRLPADTEEHRHVIDLSWMAIGRLFYEVDNFLDAAEAYSHVDRTSPEFSSMLFELAWVYVRLGDYQRAQRALEVLSIAAPESLHFADGSLLRADLMLRSGMFDRALKLYESVRRQFDPMREQVDGFIGATTDPTVYYDRLVEEELEREHGALPPVVIEWVREAAQDDRAFAVIDDVTRSRDLVKKSRKLARKLESVLGSGTRAKAFPELKAGLERTMGLLNKIGLARRTLALGLEDVDDSAMSGEMGSVRAERRKLMKRMGWLPVTDGDFARREASGERQWNKVSQRLQTLELEADKLQAIVNGLKRVLKDADKFGVTHDPASRERFNTEIAANERDLVGYRQRIRGYREAIDMGRVQIGFGDQRYVDDDRVRDRFRDVFAREVQLAAAGNAGGSSAEYARSIQPVLSRAAAAESRLQSIRSDLEEKVGRDAARLRSLVAEESRNLDAYASQLDTLDQNARVVVGEVAMRNFGLVRDRLKSIVLRADVGIVQQAWEIREEQRSRVTDLQRERAREEQNLNDELREVLDDAGDDL